MKRVAMQHTKLKRLMRALQVPQYAAVGILESMWHLTARETPDGNIGKLSDEDIALWMDWSGNASDLVGALVSCGWLDFDPDDRLYVHDWHDHADDATKKAIDRKRKKTAENGGQTSTAAENGGNVQTCPDKTRLPVPVPVPVPLKKHAAAVAAVKPHETGAESVLRDNEVERVYEAYPRRVGKRKALRAIRDAVARLQSGKDWPKLTAQEACALLHDRALAFAASDAGKQGEYTPHPATWFGQDRFIDDPKEWQRNGANTRGMNGTNGGQRDGGNAGESAASARNRRSGEAIRNAFDRFRAKPTGNADDAGEGGVSGAGDSAGDNGHVGTGMDGARNPVWRSSDKNGATGARDGFEILPPARGATGAPGGQQAATG